MSERDQLWNAFIGATETARGILDDAGRRQAEFDVNTRKLNLQRELNNKMLEFQQRGDPENWPAEMDNFFENITSQMSNKNSEYYCRNNLTANMFNNTLQNARLEYQQRIEQQTLNYEQEKNKVDFTNNVDTIFQNYSGQDAYDQAEAYLKSVQAVGIFTDPKQAENIRTGFYQRAVTDSYKKGLQDIQKEAFEAGKTAEEVWNDLRKGLKDNVVRKDQNGVPLPNVGNGEFMDGLEKEIKASYADYQFTEQKKNQEEYSNHINNCWTDIRLLLNGDNSKNVNKIRIAIDRGLTKNNNAPEHSLPNNAKEKNGDEYGQMIDVLNRIEKAEMTGNPKELIRKLFNDKTVEPLVDAAIDKFIKGSESFMGGTMSGYDAWVYLQDLCKNEYTNVTGIENPSWNDIENAAPILGKFFDLIEKRFPPEFQGVMDGVKAATILMFGSKEAANEYIPEVMNLVRDTLLELDVSEVTPQEVEKIKTRLIRNVNSLYGKALDKNKKFKEQNPNVFDGYKATDNIRNYREVIGPRKEANLAAALYERDNNQDLVMKDQWGNIKPQGDSKIQQGLTYVEADEKKFLADKIKNATGENVDISKIASEYEADGNYDVLARRVYTYNNMDYRFRSDDGKTVIMEQKPTGTTQWEQTMTAKQQAKYDSPRQVKKRAEAETKQQAINILSSKKINSVPDVDYYEIKDNNGDRIKLTLNVWNSLSEDKKRKVLYDLLTDYPEETQKWLDSLANK